MIIFDTMQAVTPDIPLRVTAGDWVTIETTGETDVQLMKAQRAGFQPLVINGDNQLLTATNNVIRIAGPAKVYFQKAEGVSATEVRVLSSFDM